MVFNSLRNRTGGPSVRARVLAAVVALLALVLAAPVVLVPLLRSVVAALS